jgi:hypothetical protein
VCLCVRPARLALFSCLLTTAVHQQQCWAGTKLMSVSWHLLLSKFSPAHILGKAADSGQFCAPVWSSEDLCSGGGWSSWL